MATATAKPTTLDALLDAMRSEEPSLGDSTSLPTYGGEEPRDTAEVWSWDETRAIVGTGSDNVRIVSREDLAAYGPRKA